jgi:hypothetical protein
MSLSRYVDRRLKTDRKKPGIWCILKPCSVREAAVSLLKCADRALLNPLCLRPKQLLADYVSSRSLFA